MIIRMVVEKDSFDNQEKDALSIKLIGKKNQYRQSLVAKSLC